MKLYLSGPITGVPYGNKPAFNDARMDLEDAGYDVLNPHDLGPQAGYKDGLTWADYLRKDLVAILTHGVDAIATLPNHQHSRGARLECHLATELDIPVGPVDFWINFSKEQ